LIDFILANSINCQKPCGASAPLFYCGFNATRGIEECLKEHGINWREEGEKD
jgi:hypothetical protein